MGVLNVTPDSFSDGARFFQSGKVNLNYLEDQAGKMLDDGADVLDIGGESTRPFADEVHLDEELQRVMPVIERLRHLDTILSVDTSKPEVATQAIAAGCNLVNDVTGFTDPRMVAAVAKSDVGVCVMHMQGKPRTMQAEPHYDDVVIEVRQFLAQQVQALNDSGVADTRIMIDPGFGFGKTLDHNLELLCRLLELQVENLPILAGWSRKSSLGEITGRSVTERKSASVTAALLAVQKGAAMVRVHDVQETVDSLKVWQATNCHERMRGRKHGN